MLPKMIRVDHGPELISNKLDYWCQEDDITLTFILAGKPTQNAFIEQFNRTLFTEGFECICIQNPR